MELELNEMKEGYSSPFQISWKLNVLQQVTLQCYGHAIQFYGAKCHSLPSPVHDVEVIVVSQKYQIIIIRKNLN